MARLPNPQLAQQWRERLDLIPAEQRLELFQRESVPLMNELHDWLIEKRNDPRVLPKSSLGKAVRYALNQWEELSVFLGEGAIPFENNETENELRSLTISRQNWLFVGWHLTPLIINYGATHLEKYEVLL